MKNLFTVSTSKSITDTATALRVAVEANGFGVMQVHDLRETMRKKGVEFDHECQIFEVCQPDQAKKVLDLDMRISTALPCRISLYHEEGMTVLATIKPTVLLEIFDTPQLQQVAQKIEETMIKIINDACQTTPIYQGDLPPHQAQQEQHRDFIDQGRGEQEGHRDSDRNPSRSEAQKNRDT